MQLNMQTTNHNYDVCNKITNMHLHLPGFFNQPIHQGCAILQFLTHTLHLTITPDLANGYCVAFPIVFTSPEGYHSVGLYPYKKSHFNQNCVFILTRLLTYFLTYFLTYVLPYLFPYFLTYLFPYFLPSLLTSLLIYLLPYLLTYFLTYYLPYFLTDFLTYSMVQSPS